MRIIGHALNLKTTLSIWVKWVFLRVNPDLSRYPPRYLDKDWSLSSWAFEKSTHPRRRAAPTGKKERGEQGDASSFIHIKIERSENKRPRMFDGAFSPSYVRFKRSG